MILSQERATLEKFFPGLDAALLNIPLLEMESRNNPAFQVFREFGGPGLLIPTEYAGLGASPLQAIRILRAIASRSPSLAVATTMHHITVVMTQVMITNQPGFALLERVARQNLYFASGFAEGQVGQNILASCMQVKETVDGLIISGSKKPCSLSRSMDLIAASVTLPAHEGDEDELVMVIIPASEPGVERYPFWETWPLAGTESDEVRLKEVYVPEECIYYMGKPGHLNSVQAQTFIWFELFISAAYLGIASALVERVFKDGKGIPSERVLLATEVEGAMAALEGLAYSIMNGEKDDKTVTKSLFVRYLVQRAIACVTTQAVEILGGMSFVKSSEVAYLLASVHALAFHPPSRLSISPALDKYLLGGTLSLM